jgi:tetratricopeptide (TPR) repeat protein
MQWNKIIWLVLTLGCFSACQSVKKGMPSKQTTKGYIEKKERAFFDAESARLTGDSKKALELYKKFTSEYPNNATGHYLLGRLYFMHSEVEKAEGEAKKASELAATNTYFREFYTQTLVYQNKQKEATVQLDLLRKANPQNTDYLYRKAMLELKNKNFTEAIAQFNEYEKLSGYSEEIVSHRKSIFLKQKKYAEALQEIRKLQQNDPHNVEYPIMLAEVFEEMKLDDSVSYIYSQIEKDHPKEPLAQVALAQYYLTKPNKEKYNYFMLEVMKNKNLATENKIALLIPTLRNMDNDSAKANVEQLISQAAAIHEESPESKEAHLLYADILYYAGKAKEACIEYKNYVRKDTSEINPYYQILAISFGETQFDSVVHYAQQCLQYYPNNPRALFNAGVAFSQLKQYDSALHYLQQGLAPSETLPLLHAEVLSSMGDAYHHLQRFKESDSLFKKVLQLQPNNAGTLNNYAYYLSLRKEKLQEAEEMSKKSLELEPRMKSFLDTYAWILYEQGRFSEAKVYMKKAIEAEGETDATLYEHLGDICFRLQEIDEAVQNWNKAFELDPTNPGLKKKINSKSLND